jgi:3-oxoacyl-ACP reductase-like protein
MSFANKLLECSVDISASERHSMNTTQQPVAVVTGASSGIGLGLTQALLERGWRVVGTSRTISSSKDLTPFA